MGGKRKGIDENAGQFLNTSGPPTKRVRRVARPLTEASMLEARQTGNGKKRRHAHDLGLRARFGDNDAASIARLRSSQENPQDPERIKNERALLSRRVVPGIHLDERIPAAIVNDWSPGPTRALCKWWKETR
ncbi:hypothetical protein B0H13DRAFT_1852543 [Mycena leptocephala]|nr:hypothetical protein B0H13DRAFT_1852543 [Mycena leptocephala]